MGKNDKLVQTESNGRVDTAPVKRVELSCHTKMSQMDGTVDVTDLMKRAQDWGHKAVAVTDRCAVYAFPEAYQFMRNLGEESSFKVIYGMEGYLQNNATDDEAYHVSILVKDEAGKVNLYKLVSLSYLEYFKGNYFKGVPLIPREELSKYREGLLLGSGCEKGELFQAVLNDEPEERIAEIVNFYDYLEVQPVMYPLPLTSEEESLLICDDQDTRNVNRRIVSLGKQFDKPVVATGNVHYLDPEDEIYLKVVKDSMRHDSYADEMPSLYLRTTDEMLEEFSYLGPEKAKEIVIDNTNQIADEIKNISPILTDRCWPEIENAEEILRDSCYAKAHDIYGDALPAVVAERLERELYIILTNGWATLFVAFREVVLHSKEAGYLVGFRGSVGASLVAYMAGITEVNPLKAHYICPDCHYTDFDPVEGKQSARMTGFDLPDRICPCCGNKLKKDGFDIPMETFFGLKGDKEPDIDLNFSGEFQGNAQQYVETIFGKGQTVFGGTIGTWSKIMAEAATRLYFENHDYQVDESEIRRVAEGCAGIKRTTGMHPGRILVIPQGEEICSLTPLQHPCGDMEADIITTHFDFHALGSSLMQLDLLRNDDPTVIRVMEDSINSPEMETGYDGEHPFSAEEIPLDDQEVISLFLDTSALGISPDDICGVPLGCLGLPEFESELVMDILQKVHPESLADLIQVAALRHGTDAWQDNAGCLIKNGQASLSEVIGTRDDIMNDLIRAGMGAEDAYEIMEMVRKGCVARGKWPDWPEYREKMRKAGIPDCYIASCEKILYLFPRAHAAGYTVMSYRIAYCKIHYPLAFYGAYFAIRSGALSYEKLLWGIETIRAAIPDYESRFEMLSERERDELKEMKVLLEMKARGFDFMPIDLNRAKADRCLLAGGKLMPPLVSIDGFASKEAASIEEAAKDGPFLSKEDFVKRTGLRRVTIDMIVDLGLL